MRKTDWAVVLTGAAISFAGIYLARARDMDFTVLWLFAFIIGPAYSGIRAGAREAGLTFVITVIVPAFAIFGYISLAGR